MNPWAWVGIAALAAWTLLMFGIICWPVGKPMLWNDDEQDRTFEELTRGWD